MLIHITLHPNVNIPVFKLGPDKRRQFRKDTANEAVIVTDAWGCETFALSELPGKMLGKLMLEGVSALLQRAHDHRTTWMAWKRELVPSTHPVAKKRPAPHAGKLGVVQQAIVLALADLPGCTADTAMIEGYVRQMTRNERDLWKREPTVILYARRLRGTGKQQRAQQASLPAALTEDHEVEIAA